MLITALCIKLYTF